MTFSETAFQAGVLKEWRMYAIHHDALNRKLKDHPIDEQGLRLVLRENIATLSSFFQENEEWATSLLPSIEGQVSALEPRLAARAQNSEKAKGDWWDLVRDYIYVKARVFQFHKELKLLLGFLDLNKAALANILEKLDEVLGSSRLKTEIESILGANKALNGAVLAGLKNKSNLLLQCLQSYRLLFQDEWRGRILLTSGGFDLFHRGHQNLLEFVRGVGGKHLWALLPNDETFFLTKKKVPIDNFEARMANVAAFVDEVHPWSIPPEGEVHRSLDFLARCLVSILERKGVEPSQCIFFTSEEYKHLVKKEVLPVSMAPISFLLLPRTERCSSTWIRAAYHHDGELPNIDVNHET